MPFPKRLIDGYNAFRSGRLKAEQNRYRELAEAGQSPQVMIVGCSDSRVSPEVIFDASPGELFVVRNVANLVPPYAPDGAYHGVSAALEFATGALKVRHIVVLGHAQCGGVQAYAEQAPLISTTDFIGRWMTLMRPAAEKVGERGDMARHDYLERMEKASIANSLDNLLTFPRVQFLVGAGELFLHGAYFGVATGQLSVRDPKSGGFMPVDANFIAR